MSRIDTYDELTVLQVVVDGHRMNLNKVDSLEVLRRLHERGLSFYEIAERLDRPTNTISRWAREIGVKPHPRHAGTETFSWTKYSRKIRGARK